MVEQLLKIQSSLNAPKGQWNDFGKYRYRSAEDILEALKPLLKEFGCIVSITDSIEHIGDRYYVKATATITNLEGKCQSATAYAREDETKKGMDGAQITGAASSYARKYALNGLLAIDDNKDPDVDKGEKLSDEELRILGGVRKAETIEEISTLFGEGQAVFKDQRILTNECTKRRKELENV